MSAEFGLTGGIGSGKTTVGQGLVARGARLIDADSIVRDLQAPGGPVLAAMVDHFGDRILTPDGSLDRQAVADIVFADEQQLEALNGIVHPAVGAEMAAQREQLAADPDAIVIVDIPLLVRADGTKGRKEYDSLAGIIVVDVEPEIAIERLVAERGFTRADAQNRIANQASRTDRLAVADFVIDNSGSLADLDHQLDACWAWLRSTSGSHPVP